jgi:hypothetical protein
MSAARNTAHVCARRASGRRSGAHRQQHHTDGKAGERPRLEASGDGERPRLPVEARGDGERRRPALRDEALVGIADIRDSTVS